MQQDPKTYVETLLGIYDQFSDLVQKAFSNDSAFVAALDRACRAVVNENAVNKGTQIKSPELLAKYCDLLLKKGAKNLEESQLEQKLSQIVIDCNFTSDSVAYYFQICR
jgi:cullin 1